MLRTARLAQWALALVVGPPAVLGQEPATVFGEVLDVRVVNVEVVVTDRQGERVTGLGPADLLLRVDGKEVPIAYFSEVREGQAVTPAAPAEGTAPEPPAGALAEGRVPTRYLVFIDDLLSLAAHRNRVLERLGRQLAALSAEDLAAVVAFDGRRLEVLSGWTRSRSELEGALARAAQRPAFGAFDRASRRAFGISDVADAAAGIEADVPAWVPVESGLATSERAYAARLLAQLGNEVAAARAAMRGFASGEGRKVMLLLAGGWPYSVQELAGGRQVDIPQKRLEPGAQLYRPLVDTANLLGFTLYPVDLPGVQTEAADASIGVGFPAVTGAGTPTSSAARDTSPVTGRQALLAESNFDASLVYLARETGGRPLLNSLRDGALEAAAADTRSYYWLGYTPDRQRDDRTHRIEVEARRRGLEVRFRASFQDLSRSAEVTMAVEGALLLGRAASDRPLPVKVGQVQAAGRNEVEIPLLIGIPVDEITILPVGQEFVADLELRVGVLNARADATKVSSTPIRLASEKAPRPGGLVRYDTKIRLGQERHDVVLALVDLATGNVLSSSFSFGNREEEAANGSERR